MKKHLKMIAISLSALIALSMPVFAQSSPDKYIGATAVSPEFYSAVAGALGVPADSTITAAQVAGITGTVDFKNKSLSDTRGLSLLTGAESIDLTGNSFTTVGQNAFRSMTNLKSVYLPSTVTEIQDGAFYGDSSLSYDAVYDSNVSFPSQIKTIGADAFNGTAFKNILLNDGITVGARAFANEKSLETVNIDYGSTDIKFDTSAFEGDKAAFEVNLDVNSYFFLNSPNKFSTYSNNGILKEDVALDLSSLGDLTLNVPSSELNFTSGITGLDLNYTVKAAPVVKKVLNVTLKENTEWDGGIPVTGDFEFMPFSVTKAPVHASKFFTNEQGIIVYKPVHNFIGTDEVDWSFSDNGYDYSGKIYINVVKSTAASGSSGKISNPDTGDNSSCIFIAALLAVLSAATVTIKIRRKCAK